MDGREIVRQWLPEGCKVANVIERPLKGVEYTFYIFNEAGTEIVHDVYAITTQDGFVLEMHMDEVRLDDEEMALVWNEIGDAVIRQGGSS